MHRYLAAILVTDIVGYSHLIERDEASFIDRFKSDRDAVIDPFICRHGGNIERLAGDGSLVIFQSITQAVQCAIDIQRAIGERNAEHTTEDQIQYRMGINLGDVIVEDGNMHGEGINVAARLESLAQPGEILITERVAEIVEGKIDAAIEFAEQRKVKNIQRAVRIHRILLDGSKTQLGPRTEHSQSRNPVSGRDNELRQLNDALENCLSNRGTVLLLAGAAGIGKTLLANELADSAIQEGANVIWGRCREDTGTPAYWPWRQILKDKLHPQIEQAARDTPELARLLPEMSDASTEDGDLSITDLSDTRFRLFSAVAELLRDAANRRPLVLIFDDLHRADTPSLQLLEFVATDLTNSAVMLLGTYRQTDIEQGHRFQNTISELSRLNGYQSVMLTNLDKQSVNEIVIRELGDAVNTVMVRQVFARTEGHPLYLIETLRHLRQGGEGEVLPSSLRAIINQRFSKLDERCLNLLQAAAIIGREFSLSALHALLDTDIDDILNLLDGPLSSGHVEAMTRPGQYRFDHALIREAIYDSLGGGQRLRLHCQLAEWLEQQGGESAPIAYHFFQAAPLGVAGKAMEYSQKAGAEADRMLAFEAAIRFYQQALNIAEEKNRAPITLALGRAQLRVGESLQAAASFDQAAELAETYNLVEIHCEASIGIGEALWRPGLPGHNAVRLLEKSLMLLNEDDVRRRILIMSSLVRAYSMIANNSNVKIVQEELETIARAQSDKRLLARAILAGNIASLSPECLQYRLKRYQECMNLVQRSDDAILYNDVLMWYIHDLLTAGNIDLLEALLKDQISIARRAKQPFFQYFALLHRSTLSLSRGQFTESESFSNEALDVCRWLPGQDGEGVYGVQMFNIRREQGQLRQLVPVIENFVNTTPDSATWKPGLALIYSDIGRYDDARMLLSNLAKNKFSAIPRDGLWPTCLAYLSEVCAVLDDTKEAAVLYKLLAPYKGINLVIGVSIGCLGSADRFLGMLATVLGDWARAEDHFQFAVKKNNEQNFAVWAMHTRYQYAVLLSRRKGQKDREYAQSILDDVLTTSRQFGMSALTDQAIILRNKVRSGPTKIDNVDGLSKREIEVLQKIAIGKDNKEIAATLFISANTVAAHVRNILGKTNTSNRTEAAAYAVKQGLITK